MSFLALSGAIHGHAGISAEMAIRLKKTGWGTAESRIRVQAVDDLAQAWKRGGRDKGEKGRSGIIRLHIDGTEPPSHPAAACFKILKTRCWTRDPAAAREMNIPSLCSDSRMSRIAKAKI